MQLLVLKQNKNKNKTSFLIIFNPLRDFHLKGYFFSITEKYIFTSILIT